MRPFACLSLRFCGSLCAVRQGCMCSCFPSACPPYNKSPVLLPVAIFSALIKTKLALHFCQPHLPLCISVSPHLLPSYRYSSTPLLFALSAFLSFSLAYSLFLCCCLCSSVSPSPPLFPVLSLYLFFSLHLFLSKSHSVHLQIQAGVWECFGQSLNCYLR